MLNKNKTVIARNLNHQYLVTFEYPEGFKDDKGALTAPNGTKWLYNGFGYFEVNEYGVGKRLEVLHVENINKFKRSQFYKDSTFTKLNFENYAINITPKI